MKKWVIVIMIVTFALLFIPVSDANKDSSWDNITSIGIEVQDGQESSLSENKTVSEDVATSNEGESWIKDPYMFVLVMVIGISIGIIIGLVIPFIMGDKNGSD